MGKDDAWVEIFYFVLYGVRGKARRGTVDDVLSPLVFFPDTGHWDAMFVYDCFVRRAICENCRGGGILINSENKGIVVGLLDIPHS